MSGKLVLHVHGHRHEVTQGALQAELGRRGPPPKLPLLEAILRHGPRAEATQRLVSMLEAEVVPGSAYITMHAALGLLGLMPEEPAAREALRRYGTRVGGAAGATLLAGVMLLESGPAALCAEGVDPLLVRQAARAVAVLRQPGPLAPALRPLVAAWIAALAEASKTLGAQAFRAYLGDVAEALYRVVQRSEPPCPPEALLTEEQAALLLDTVAFELPGTADFLAARAMVWLLGLFGPPDDAGTAAIERARDRFANEAFHADCATILGGGPWPPGRRERAG